MNAQLPRRAHTTRLTVASPRGDFYLLHDGGGTNMNRLLRYRPPQDTCTDSDLRDRVHAGDVDSEVPNRYTGNGCTINDLIHDDREWPNHGSFVRHVDSVTGQLVADGVITDREQGQIVRAAGHSDIGG